MNLASKCACSSLVSSSLFGGAEVPSLLVLKLPPDNSFSRASSGVVTFNPWRRDSGIPAAAEIYEVED
jgi:hypothetical protein